MGSLSRGRMTIGNISKSGQNRFSSAIAWQHGGPGGILEYDILYYGIGGQRGGCLPLSGPAGVCSMGGVGVHRGVGRGAVDIPGRQRMDIFITSYITLSIW